MSRNTMLLTNNIFVMSLCWHDAFYCSFVITVWFYMLHPRFLFHFVSFCCFMGLKEKRFFWTFCRSFITFRLQQHIYLCPFLSIVWNVSLKCTKIEQDKDNIKISSHFNIHSYFLDEKRIIKMGLFDLFYHLSLSLLPQKGKKARKEVLEVILVSWLVLI